MRSLSITVLVSVMLLTGTDMVRQERTSYVCNVGLLWSRAELNLGT